MKVFSFSKAQKSPRAIGSLTDIDLDLIYLLFFSMYFSVFFCFLQNSYQKITKNIKLILTTAAHIHTKKCPKEINKNNKNLQKTVTMTFAGTLLNHHIFIYNHSVYSLTIEVFIFSKNISSKTIAITPSTERNNEKAISGISEFLLF